MICSGIDDRFEHKEPRSMVLTLGTRTSHAMFHVRFDECSTKKTMPRHFCGCEIVKSLSLGKLFAG